MRITRFFWIAAALLLVGCKGTDNDGGSGGFGTGGALGGSGGVTSQSTSDVAGLRDALVVSGSLAYVCGVFVGVDKNQYSGIRKSTDGGRTWSVVHSEPSNNTYTSVVLDPTGRAHAMRHVTDAYANEYSYTGHYVLP
jgi:hypothetical protein